MRDPRPFVIAVVVASACNTEGPTQPPRATPAARADPAEPPAQGDTSDPPPPSSVVVTERPPAEPCTGWSEIANLGGDSVVTLAARSGKDMFAVGLSPGLVGEGTLYRWTGGDWEAIHSVDWPLYDLWIDERSMYLAQDKSMVAGGQVLRHDGRAWQADVGVEYAAKLVRSGCGGSSIVIATSSQSILRCEAGTCVTLRPDHWGRLTHGLWCFEDGSILVVGSQNFGAVLERYDGTQWEPAVQVPGSFRGIWGVGEAVFVVGNDGLIFHYDGDRWVQQESGTEHDLWGVWARRRDDAFAVGEAGTILHYDGDAWVAQPSGAERDLTAVSGLDNGEVFVAGFGGPMLICRP